MEKGVWAYPWDLFPEPDCARRHADMGLTYVCVATRYHAVRALSYRPDGPRITTHRQSRSWLEESAELSHRYAATGLAVDAWIVCFHEDPTPEGQRMINCLGDEYPWAACPRHPEARERILSFIEQAAGTGAFRSLELEAFGFYGFSHGCEHDKVQLPAHPLLAEALSLCCCPRCRQATGVEADEVAAFVKQLLLGSLDDGPPGKGGRDDLERILAVEAAARATYSDELLAEAMQRVSGRARIRLQVSPDPRALGAVRPMPSPTAVMADELVVPVWSRNPAEVRDAVQQLFAFFLDRPMRPRITAGFAAIPPYCQPKHLGQAVATIQEARPGGLCAYHDGMMHPDARRAYAEALAAQS